MALAAEGLKDLCAIVKLPMLGLRQPYMHCLSEARFVLPAGAHAVATHRLSNA